MTNIVSWLTDWLTDRSAAKTTVLLSLCTIPPCRIDSFDSLTNWLVHLTLPHIDKLISCALHERHWLLKASTVRLEIVAMPCFLVSWFIKCHTIAKKTSLPCILQMWFQASDSLIIKPHDSLHDALQFQFAVSMEINCFAFLRFLNHLAGRRSGFKTFSSSEDLIGPFFWELIVMLEWRKMVLCRWWLCNSVR